MEWSIQDIGALGEAVSAVAVVVTLFYLVFQLRQSNIATETANRLVRSTAAWNADVNLAEINERLAQNQQLSELVMRVHDPETKPEDLTSGEFAQWMILFRGVLQKYQSQWFLWKEGNLPDEMWQMRRRWAKAVIMLPVPGKVWEMETGEQGQHQFTVGFVESINSMELSGKLGFKV